MIRNSPRRIVLTIVAVALFGAIGIIAAPAPAQDDLGRQPGERAVESAKLPLDRDGIWTLNFRYKPIRILTLDGFDAKGNPAKQVVWYLWYQVYNRSGEPVQFVPEFELVTTDLNTNHLDEPQPFIFEQVKKYEDRTITAKNPNGILNLKSSIDISKKPIPASLPEGFPKLVSGLAIWTDMDAPGKARKTNRFSVYITGLSNGVAVEQKKLPNDEILTLVKKKTLRIDFIRPTDETRPQISDIQPDEASGRAETWVYRTAPQSVAAKATPMPAPKQ
jgi:hypothetical protein